MDRAHRCVGNVLQQVVRAINGGVAVGASPFRSPRIVLPAVNGCPLHVAIWEFLPCFRRCGPCGVCKVDARAT